MSQIDGAKSVHGSSEEIFLQTCGPCSYGGTSKEPTRFCNDCKEYLCPACTESHKGLKISRNHKLLFVTEMSEAQTVTNAVSCIVFCDCIRNSAVTIYCCDHNDVICQACKEIKHIKCKTLTLNEKSVSYSEVELVTVMEKVSKLKDEIDMFLSERNADFEKLALLKEKCKNYINSIRQELNTVLDLLEEKALKELDNYELSEREELERHISACTTTKHLLETDAKLLDDAKNTSGRGAMFSADVKISQHLDDYAKLLRDIGQERKLTNITFIKSEQLLDLQNKVKELGHFEVDFAKPCKSTSTGKLFPELKFEISDRVDITIEKEKHTSLITGCAFMPSDEILLCDYNNHSIKLLSDSSIIKGSLSLKSSPWGVSVINSSSALITLPYLKQLQYIQVVPALNTGSAILLNKMCWDVDVVKDEIYTTCHNYPGQGEIRILDMEGNLKRQVGVKQDGSFLFQVPYYLTVSKTSGNIYVSDYRNATVTCMAVDGSVVYQCKHPDLNCVNGICIDSGDNIIIVCRDIYSNTSSAHLVCNKDIKKQTLLLSKDGLQHGYSVAYRHTDNALLIIGGADNCLLIIRGN